MENGTEALMQYLNAASAAWKEGALLERLILECGKDFTPATRPPGMRKQRDKQCFRNATNLALRRDDLRYVEGFAISAGLFPVLHAWCVTASDVVVDPTWAQPEQAVYRGVVIPRKLLVHHIIKSKVYGILSGEIFINVEAVEQLRKLHTGGENVG